MNNTFLEALSKSSIEHCKEQTEVLLIIVVMFFLLFLVSMGQIIYHCITKKEMVV